MKPALLYYIIDTDIDVIGLIDNIAIPTTYNNILLLLLLLHYAQWRKCEPENTEWAREGVINIFDLGAPLTKKFV